MEYPITYKTKLVHGVVYLCEITIVYGIGINENYRPFDMPFNTTQEDFLRRKIGRMKVKNIKRAEIKVIKCFTT